MMKLKNRAKIVEDGSTSQIFYCHVLCLQSSIDSPFVAGHFSIFSGIIKKTVVFCFLFYLVAAMRRHSRNQKIQVINDYQLGLSPLAIKSQMLRSLWSQLDRREDRYYEYEKKLMYLTAELLINMDLEQCEGRYILCGTEQFIEILDSRYCIVRGNADTRGCGAKWFPFDYRMFSSISRKKLSIWDANRLIIVDHYLFDDTITMFKHALFAHQSQIAVISKKSAPRIVDVRTGNFSCTLKCGPRHDISWSPACEYTLATAGRNGIDVWDSRSLSKPVISILDNLAGRIKFYPDGVRLASTRVQSNYVAIRVDNIVKNSFTSHDVTGESRSPSTFFYLDYMLVCFSNSVHSFGNALNDNFSIDFLNTNYGYAFNPLTFELFYSRAGWVIRYDLFAENTSRIDPHAEDNGEIFDLT